MEVWPNMGMTAQTTERKAPGFLAALQAFLTNPDDTTGLRLFHLRE
jgi:hypothetical protein